MEAHVCADIPSPVVCFSQPCAATCQSLEGHGLAAPWEALVLVLLAFCPGGCAGSLSSCDLANEVRV